MRVQALYSVIGILFISIVMYVLFDRLGQDPREIPSVQLGQLVPDRMLPTLNGGPPKQIKAYLKGKPSLIHFWATWCMTCQVEHPTLIEDQRFKGMTFIGVLFKDDPVHASQWLRRMGNPYQVVLLDHSGELAMDMGVYGTPETFLVDAQGRIVLRHTGLVDDRVWRTVLLPALQKLKLPRVDSVRGLHV